MDPSTGETACSVPDNSYETARAAWDADHSNMRAAAKAWQYIDAQPEAINVSSGSGTAWANPPAAASPSYSSPPTARTTFDRDAVASAFTTSTWGGQRFAATSGNPQSYYTAPPSWLTDYVQSVQQSASAGLSAQKALSDQNAQAFQALVQAGAGASASLNRPMPVVVDPNNPVFQLRLPSEQAAASARGGISTWGYLAAAAVGFIVWKKMRKGGGRGRAFSQRDE